MKIIFQIDGGIGKNIAATAVCRAIKRQYPHDQLIVMTAYPEVFQGNPNVDMSLNSNDRNYFFKNHIEGQQIKAMLHNPYFETDFVAGKSHLIQVWCEMFGIAYQNEQPELFISEEEYKIYRQQFNISRPVFLIQTNGGTADQPNKYSWARDLPFAVAERVVREFSNSHQIVHLKREDQPVLPGTTPFQGDFRAVATLIALSDKRLLIDSFAHHAAAALGKSAVVCWVANKPEQFGYSLHCNIQANKETAHPDLRNAQYFRYNITGDPAEFPYVHEADIFDTHGILAALKGNAMPVNKGFDCPQPLKQRIMAEYNGGNMVAQRLVWLLGYHELADIGTILDIGSWHLGQSIEFAGIFPSATIHAFEPVPESFAYCLERRSQLPEAARQKINVHNIALNNCGGEIPFYPVNPTASSVPNVGASSMFKFIEGLNGTPFGQELIQDEIKVTGMKLDDWSAEAKVENIDIIWMDVQGAELRVLQGGAETLKRTKILMTEVGLKPYYDGHSLKADIDSFLNSIGFEEVKESFELNGFDYEANTIYINKFLNKQ